MNVAKIAMRVANDYIAARGNDYIFLILDKEAEENGYRVGVSVHDDPKLGFQVLRDHMSKNDARRVLRQLENKWKEAETLQFEQKGQGHRKRFKKKKLI